MMDINVTYCDAAEAARKAALSVTEAEYNGFCEISDGGLLGSREAAGELRLSGDSVRDYATSPIDVREIRRDYITYDASCLNKGKDGRVCVKIDNN